jgi:hypothetical protein
MNSTTFEEDIELTDAKFEKICNSNLQEVVAALQDPCESDEETKAGLIQDVFDCANSTIEFNSDTCALSIRPDAYQSCMDNALAICTDSFRNIFLVSYFEDQDIFQERFHIHSRIYQKTVCQASEDLRHCCS